MNSCTTKRCSSYIGSVKLDRRAQVLGIGCLRNGCLIGTSAGGSAALSYVTEQGKVKWNKPLEARAASVSIVGVGTGAFAVADGATVTRYEQKDGAATRLWQGSASTTPALAWAGGRLAIAYDRGGELVTETVAVP